MARFAVMRSGILGPLNSTLAFTSVRNSAKHKGNHYQNQPSTGKHWTVVESGIVGMRLLF